MITFSIDKKSLDDLIKEVNKISEVLVKPDLQMYRARKFRDYVKKVVKERDLDLDPIHQATVVVHGGDHPPEYNRGGLLEAMQVRKAGKDAADMGFFESSGSPSGQRGKKNKTWAELAILQHTGYRIPLFGEAGKRVRAYLAAKGVFTLEGGRRPSVKGSKNWIIVKPRPFLTRAYLQYEMNGEDTKAADEFINNLLSGTPSGTQEKGKSK